MRIRAVLIMSAFTVCGYSCNSSEFAGAGSGRKIVPPPVTIDYGKPQKNGGDLVTDEFWLSSTSIQKPVEIIFVVDTSASMDEEKGFLEQQMNTFMLNFTVSGKTNYKIFMIGKGFNFPTMIDPNRFEVVNRSVLSFDALTALSEFLRPRLLAPTGKLGMTRHAVIITDDDAARGGAQGGGSTPMNAMQFKSSLGIIMPGSLRIHGLVGLRAGPNNQWCKVDGVGNEYISLANDPLFKGQIQDLCNPNWGLLLSNLANEIISEMRPTNHPLSHPVDSAKPITVSVNGRPISPNGYRLDPSSQSIFIQEVTRYPPQSSVRVEYYPR